MEGQSRWFFRVRVFKRFCHKNIDDAIGNIWQRAMVDTLVSVVLYIFSYFFREFSFANFREPLE